MADDLARLQRALAGRYVVQREVGRGGMATVYLAKDVKHHRLVAIKVLAPELAAALGPERFLREIEVSAGLSHPHILPLHDSGEAAGFLYYVMPFVDGESLRDRLTRDTQLPLDDALQIAREVADALSYAHRHDVVHRDVKPENILLESGHAVVADFGIARAISAARGQHPTATGVAVGTPAYMSPEQAAGSNDIDGRSDVYSLGCVLYEMLAGQPPFTGPAADSVVRQHLAAQPPNIMFIRPSVPVWVAAALTKALAKTPADRFASVARFAEALAGGEGLETSPGKKPASHLSRRWRLLALASFVVVLGAVGALLTHQFGRGSEPPAHAEPVHERTAIAILPFQNLSTEGPYAYFAGGLHDELLTQLSKVVALTVISRTSVMSYAGRSTPLRQIAAELGVGSVVEGSVQVVGTRLRVNVQLIDATSDAPLWSERYDRKLDDAFAIQSDVAMQIVTAVGAALSHAEQQTLSAPPTANAEAYRLYVQGLDYFTRPGYDRQNLVIAQQLLERALALDTGFALAHAELSQVHGVLYWFRYDPSTERRERQREAAVAALRFAPTQPEAHIAMGMAHYQGHRDYRRALNEFAIALEGLPNHAQLWANIGYVQRRLGDWTKVFDAFERATQLDPRNADLFSDLGGTTFRLVHRYAEAARAYDQSLSIAPDNELAALLKGQTYVIWHGQLDTLRAVLRRLPREVEVGAIGTNAAQYLDLALWERQADSMLQLLESARRPVFEGIQYFIPSSLYAAWAHQLRHDLPSSRAAFDSARVFLDSVLIVLPNDWRVHAARGQALAGLGRRGEALSEARWLQGSVAYREDAFFHPLLAEDRARILAKAGDLDAALDEIERLLAGPSVLSVHTLRLDPRWDPVRDHARYRTLLTKYAKP